MKQILCFGDSNTYGLIPKADDRYPWNVRWTSILNEKLGLENYRVIEEGLCGRTTVFEDPLRKSRCGIHILPAILETNRPIDIVVVMLGTNDCKTIFGATAEVIGKGISSIIEQIRTYSSGSKILLISPIHLGEDVWKKEYDPEFSAASVSISKELAAVYKDIAEKENIYFLDAASYAVPSSVDQEHLDEEGHRLLAEAVYDKVIEMLV
ncbi:MAG: SGNH/GDSL hydrolase family protein [Lachnospiraceae bacterium]|nr:SGNH/GDSL hydrolase family protein [Lachnospiraceae bacterium]